MPSRRVRLGSYALTLEVPQSTARLLRRVLPRRPAPDGPAPLQPLQIRFEDAPPVSVDGRDAARALDFFRLPAGHEPRPLPAPVAPPGADPDLVAEVARHPWYHTIELPGGIVTPGQYDQRPLVSHYGLPDDLTGRRALDVATFDGFWAFELERRGAAVTALDIPAASSLDLPPPARERLREEGVDAPIGQTFELARRALGSRVERVTASVYDLDPAVHGRFDLVHMGDLLLHLERPLEALRRIHSVTAGTALIGDVYQADLDADPRGRRLVEYRGGWREITWWLPSLGTLCQMVVDAGFADVRVHTTYRMATAWHAEAYSRAVLVARP